MTSNRLVSAPLIVLLLWPIALLGQAFPPVGGQQVVMAHTPAPAASYLDVPDSLLAIRHMFSTTISQRGKDLSKPSIIQVLNATPTALSAYRTGKILQPVGPVLIVSGLALSYVGLQGRTMSGYIRPVHTLTNPSGPDIPVDYTVRNLPEVIGGVGLIVGGICLVELANGLLTKSIKLHNDRVIPRRLRLQNIKVGMTTGGNVGLTAAF